MEIAVMVDEQGKTSGLEQDGTLRIYSKTDGEWSIVREKKYYIQNITNAALLRECICEIGKWMMESRILIVNRIRGIHYIAFEEHQISMLEIKGLPEDFLDDVRDCLRHQRTGKEVPLEHNAIYEAQPGIYYTDLREVMKGNTSYSSKQILLPFIKNREFKSLEILCEHVPKWLEKNLTELKLMLTVEKFKDCLKVRIYHKVYKQDDAAASHFTCHE